MRVIRRDFYHCSQEKAITIVPIFDLHLGAAACDEKRLIERVQYVKADPSRYWIGGGDMCDFISRKDNRFDLMNIAKWCRDRPDIVGEQVDRFESIFAPIADKCIAFVRGNHEESILRHYERDVYSDMLKILKQNKEEPLGVGTYGWLLVGLYRSKKKERGSQIRFNLHHGFTGGRLQGAKALNIQRWLWTHDCDIALQGHSHNSMMQAEQVEGISDMGEPWEKRRFGIFCGTFLNNHADNDGTYSENKGYLPQGQIHWEIRLRPYEQDPLKRVEVVAI